MNYVIYKYPIGIKDKFSIEMPTGARILTIQVQDNVPCMWVLVDTSQELEIRNFKIIGTGHSLDEFHGNYIGTVQMANGFFVWHIFEDK